MAARSLVSRLSRVPRVVLAKIPGLDVSTESEEGAEETNTATLRGELCKIEGSVKGGNQENDTDSAVEANYEVIDCQIETASSSNTSDPKFAEPLLEKLLERVTRAFLPDTRHPNRWVLSQFRDPAQGGFLTFCSPDEVRRIASQPYTSKCWDSWEEKHGLKDRKWWRDLRRDKDPDNLMRTAWVCFGEDETVRDNVAKSFSAMEDQDKEGTWQAAWGCIERVLSMSMFNSTRKARIGRYLIQRAEPLFKTLFNHNTWQIYLDERYLIMDEREEMGITAEEDGTTEWSATYEALLNMADDVNMDAEWIDMLVELLYGKGMKAYKEYEARRKSLIAKEQRK